MTIHTTFPKGKKIRLIMKHGRHVTGRYEGKTARYIVLEGDQKYEISKIRAAMIER
jgi:hypothetical protein